MSAYFSSIKMRENVSEIRIDLSGMRSQEIVPRKGQNCEEYNRINALSVFVKKTERQRQEETLLERIVNPKDKLISLSATNLKKSGQRKSKKTAESTDLVFPNDNNKKQYIGKYNCTNVYIKTRLDRQNWSELSRDFKAQDDQIKSNLDSQGNRLNGNSNRKLQIEANQNKIKPKQSNKEILEIKRDIIAENIKKQGKKLCANPVKRIPATSNYVYEFNPLVTADQLNPLTSQTCLRSSNSSEQKFPCARIDITSIPNSNSNVENGNLVKRKPSAILPELNSRIDFVKDHSNWNAVDSTQNTCLPILKKENSAKTLSRQQLDDKHEPSDTDHEVEKVKSAWQALRAERNWAKDKDCIGNVHTKKLYEILEKMTGEIDKIQKRYTDPKTNHYLRKSATYIPKTPSKSNLEEEMVKNMILPMRKAKIDSEISHLKNFNTEMISKDIEKIRFNEATENILTNKQSTKNTFSSKPIVKNRSIYTNTYGCNIENDIIPVSIPNATNTCDKKQDAATDSMELIFNDANQTNVKIKSSIEKYLQNYSDNIYKPCDIEEREKEEKEHFQNIKSSVSDIKDILANHNIESQYGLYENFEKYDDVYDSEDNTSEKSTNFPYLNMATNTTQVTFVDPIQDDKRICDNTFSENTELYKNDMQPMKVDTKSIGQSNLASCQNNAFIKIRLNVLEKNLSKDKLSQILRSEYLKKNLSL